MSGSFLKSQILQDSATGCAETFSKIGILCNFDMKMVEVFKGLSTQHKVDLNSVGFDLTYIATSVCLLEWRSAHGLIACLFDPTRFRAMIFGVGS